MLIKLRDLLPALAALLLAAGTALPGEAPGAGEPGPLQDKGVLEHLPALTPLAWRREGIRLDQEAHEADDPAVAQATVQLEQQYLAMGVTPDQARRLARQRTGSGGYGAFQRLASAAGANQRSTSGGSDGFRFSFSGGPIEGSLSEKKESVEIALSETGKVGRRLAITDDGKGAFELKLGVEGKEPLLRVSCSPDKGFRAEWRSGEEKRSVDGKSFAEAYAKHRDLLENELFPRMKELGLGVPPTPMSAEVARIVADCLRPVSDADRAEAAKLLAQLDANSFTEREDASRKLSESYGRYRRLIPEHLARKDLSLEVRTRLEAIVEANAGYARKTRVVDELGLLGDAGYLTALQEQLDGEDREVVAARAAELAKSAQSEQAPDAH